MMIKKSDDRKAYTSNKSWEFLGPATSCFARVLAPWWNGNIPKQKKLISSIQMNLKI